MKGSERMGHSWKWLTILGVVGLSFGADPAFWTPMKSLTTASFRGLSVHSATTAWTSGTGGTVLRTIDGGRKWTRTAQTSADGNTLDFRDIEAFSSTSAVLLSSGPGNTSRVFRTADGGASWTLSLTNPDAEGFFDALAFWDEKNGILLGDPVDGRFTIFTTSDSGRSWIRRQGPAAGPSEGAFAASGTCLVAEGPSTAWFGTGHARVFRTTDRGLTWTFAQTPIRHDAEGSGIFSLAFSGAHGIAVGGNYQKSNEDRANIALSDDGGLSWRLPSGQRPAGYRSAVIWLDNAKSALAVGTTGTSSTKDGGESWREIDAPPVHALAQTKKLGFLLAVGPKGTVLRGTHSAVIK